MAKSLATQPPVTSRKRLWIAEGRRIGVEGWQPFVIEADALSPAAGGGAFFWNHGEKGSDPRGVLCLGEGCCRVGREFADDDFDLPITPGVITART